MPEELKLAVLGTSWWVDAMHLPAIAQHPQARTVAICGRDEARAQAMAARWDVPRVYTDWRQMLETGGFDAVIVATGNDSHFPISMAAMQQGLPVLCEKPLALNYADARTMASYASQHQIPTLVPFTYSYMPSARYLKALLAEGYIGQPYHLNMRYYTGFAREGDYLWRFDLRKAGAGVVGDLGTHFLYLAEWYFGEISRVSASLGYHVPRPAHDPEGKSYPLGDDSAIITCEFANGAQGVIHVSAVCYEETPFGQTHHMEFHGSAGTLYAFTDWDRVQELRGARLGEGAPQPLPIPEDIWQGARRDTVHNTYRDIFRQQDFMTRQFISAVLEGRPLTPSFTEGARVQRVLAAAQRSASEGRWVAVEEIL